MVNIEPETYKGPRPEERDEGGRARSRDRQEGEKGKTLPSSVRVQVGGIISEQRRDIQWRERD